MKKLLFALSILFSSHTSFCQSAWFIDDATWINRFGYFAVIGYNKLTVTGDTIIDGTSCKQIHIETKAYDQSNGLYYQDSSIEFYYEKDGIFYRDYNGLDTMFDFNKAPGEYWNMIPYSGCPDTYKVVVADTGHLTISNVSLKFLKVNYFYDQYSITDTLIWRIGSQDRGLDFIHYCIPDEGGKGAFCSYHDAEIPFYSSLQFQVDCEYLPTGISETHLKNDPEIFPNPVRDQFQLLDLDYPVEEIVITDVSGRKILQVRQPRFPLNISNLYSGIFICNVKCSNQIFTAKLLKL